MSTGIIGNTLRFEVEFQDYDNVTTDPEDVYFRAYNMKRELIYEDNNPNKEADGKYFVDYEIPTTEEIAEETDLSENYIDALDAENDVIYIEFEGVLVAGHSIKSRMRVQREWYPLGG